MAKEFDLCSTAGLDASMLGAVVLLSASSCRQVAISPFPVRAPERIVLTSADSSRGDAVLEGSFEGIRELEDAELGKLAVASADTRDVESPSVRAASCDFQLERKLCGSVCADPGPSLCLAPGQD